MTACKTTAEQARKCEESLRASALSTREPAIRESPGRPLDVATRAILEPRFGHNFSRVRVHTDTRSAALSRSANAVAFTHGNDIFFDHGRYNPQSVEGRRLLAHELAHVVQQQASGSAGEVRAEQEATAVERNLLSGKPLAVTHRTGTRIARQGGSAALQQVFHYGRDQFDGRFDGEVNRRSHTVRLIMGVEFTPAGFPSYVNTDDVIAKFATDMKKTVESAWSYKYALQSVCEADKYEARVELIPNAQKPHNSIYLHPDTPGGQSGVSEDESALKESDNTYTEREHVYDSGKGTPKEGTFYQQTSAHEFGHMMGLSHIRCKGNQDRCYGLTADELSDVMGIGSVVSKRDYAPFQKIMERFGKDTLPTSCNSWRPVSPG